MKGSAELQQFKKCLILFMVGIICGALSYAVYVVNPVKMLFEYKLQMSPSSTLFTLWKQPPIDVYIKVYIFNVTNPEQFLAGEEKLKVQEIGPYVYQEILENDNITWNDNGTVSYYPKRTVLYVPEMSVGDPEKVLIIVPNIPMLGITSALKDMGFLVNFPFTQLTNILDSKSFLNITVYDYLWGYDDSLVRLASTVVPNFINFRKFGLLDRMYDEGDNIITMNVNKNENMTDEIGRYLSIENYNGSPGLAHWGYQPTEGNETNPLNTICNRIEGASEGTVFPTDMDPTAVFRIYRKAFCRTIPISFQKEVTTDSGLKAFQYTLTDDFLETPENNPDNECYCRGMSKCLRKGLSDLTPCYYNIPAALSLPHFLDADPTLLDEVDGLHPDPEKHRTAIYINPRVGIPMMVNSRMQTNLVMGHTSYNSKVTPFNDLTIPIFWTDLYIPSLPSDLELLLKMLVNVMPVVQTVFISLLAIGGVTTFVLSLLGTLWIVHQQDPAASKSDEPCDLKISLGAGQYTAIRILPAIKKITSRTDLFG